MRDAVTATTPTSDSAPPRRVWTSPLIKTLPKLTDLTLASAIGGGGGTGGGGSTVFGILLALLTLAGCSAERGTSPSDGLPEPVKMHLVTCQVAVATSTVACHGPQRAPGEEILGGQGSYVVLRSTNVSAAAGVFSADISVQNLGAQPIGTPDGTTESGVFVFFESGPTVTGGTGNVLVANASGTGTFTAGLQPYFQYDTLLAALEESASMTWEWSYDVGVTNFEFTVLVAAEVPEVGGMLRWSPVAGMEDLSINFRGVAANGPEDVMAIGNGAHYYRRTASGWTRHTQTLQGSIFSVASTGAEVFFGIGYDGGNGIVARFNGSVWTTIGSFPDIELLAITPEAGGVMVGGYDYGAGEAFLAFYDGSWTTWNIPGVSAITAIGWEAPGLPFLLTADGDILTYDDPDWTVAVASTAIDADINTVLMLGPAAFLYGGRVDRGGPEQEAFVAASDGSTVDTIYLGGIGEIMALLPKAGGTWVFQENGEPNFFTTFTRFLEWDGDAVSPLDSVSSLYPPLATVDGTEFLLAAGAGVLRWEGSGIDLELGDPFAEFEYNGIAAVGNNVYVTTEAGEVLSYDGTNWSTESVSGARLEGIWAISPTDIYAGGAEGMFHYDGIGWTHLPLAEVGEEIVSMWGSGNTLFASKTDTTFVWSGGSWTPYEIATGSYFRAIWGTGPTDVYAVAYPYGVMHFNGVTWADLPLPPRADGDSSFQMTGIGGSSATDIWMGTDRELAFRFDGTTITEYSADGMSTIGGILSIGPGAALLGGDGIYRASGGAILSVSHQGLRGEVGVVQTADGRIWALGTRGLSVATR